MSSNGVSAIARKETYATLFLLLLIFAANKFFSLGPWWYRSGVFNVQDVGNALLWMGLLSIITFAAFRRSFRNPLSVLILAFVVLSFFSVFLASYHYGQSVFDGIVGIRHNFYYLAFFLFLFVLDDVAKIRRFLDVLIVISLALLALSVVNYFGPTVFTHAWAEGQGLRAGIKRAYIPGVEIITISTLWAFTKWIDGDRGWSRNRSLLITVFLLAALLFRQTRVRIMSVTLVLWAALLVRRKWKPLLVFVVLSAVMLGVLGMVMEENVLVKAFSTAFTDVQEQRGTFPTRKRQMRADMEEFKRHPIIGSGAAAVRYPTAQGGSRLQYAKAGLTTKWDLGYTSWLSFYGLVGMTWLFLFLYFQFSMARRVLKGGGEEEKMLARFTLSVLFYEVLSFVTLPQFIAPDTVILVCLNAAIIVFLYFRAEGAPGLSRKGVDGGSVT